MHVSVTVTPIFIVLIVFFPAMSSISFYPLLSFRHAIQAVPATVVGSEKKKDHFDDSRFLGQFPSRVFGVIGVECWLYMLGVLIYTCS